MRLLRFDQLVYCVRIIKTSGSNARSKLERYIERTIVLWIVESIIVVDGNSMSISSDVLPISPILSKGLISGIFLGEEQVLAVFCPGFWSSDLTAG